MSLCCLAVLVSSVRGGPAVWPLSWPTTDSQKRFRFEPRASRAWAGVRCFLPAQGGDRKGRTRDVELASCRGDAQPHPAAAAIAAAAAATLLSDLCPPPPLEKTKIRT